MNHNLTYALALLFCEKYNNITECELEDTLMVDEKIGVDDDVLIEAEELLDIEDAIFDHIHPRDIYWGDEDDFVTQLTNGLYLTLTIDDDEDQLMIIISEDELGIEEEDRVYICL